MSDVGDIMNEQRKRGEEAGKRGQILKNSSANQKDGVNSVSHQPV